MAEFKISYDGLDASDGNIDIAEVGHSLSGLGQALHRAAYYVEHKKVRYRAPYSEKIKIMIRAPVRGSVEFDAVLWVVGTVALGVTSNAIYGFAKAALKRATGIAPTEERTPLEKIAPTGDFEAVADSMVSPLKRAHNIIGQNARSISIYRPAEPPIMLNQKTKDYLEYDRFNPEIRQLIMRVTSMNGYDRSGKVFIKEIGRGVPFKIDDTANERSIDALLWSHGQFYRKKDSEIFVTFQSFEALDGKIKKI